MASLGTGPLTSVRINELTTVASAYAFAQLFRNDYSIGGSSLPLSIAAGMAENLVLLLFKLRQTDMRQTPGARLAH